MSVVSRDKEKQYQVEATIHQLLRLLDFNPDFDENLKDTPARVARFWKEFLEYDPGNIEVTFESVRVDQMVVVKDIPAFSLCSHHLLPMSLTVHVGYIPVERVLGLSKIPRIVQKYAHTLQLQERLTAQIATHVEEAAEPLGVAVVIQGVHSCMTMRGIRSPGEMVTSDLRGAFRENADARREFFSILGKS